VGKKKREKNTAVSGMPRGTANARLRKKVLFELLRSAGTNICHRCEQPISISEDLAIEHVEDWKDDDELFWKLTNIAFSHLDCSSGAARQEDKRMLVDVTVENEHGEELPTFHHKGGIYIAGRKGERYNLRITNQTSERIEVVATVDGRDVISGEKGDITNTGYVIRPYDDILVKGFRQNHGQVAAFRFSSKGASYSARSGTSENVGVIGVAVFREKQEPPQWIWNPPPIVVNPPPVVVNPNPYPWTTYYTSNTGGGGGGTFTSSGNVSCNSLGVDDVDDCAFGEDSISIQSNAAPAPEVKTRGGVTRGMPTSGVECWEGRPGASRKNFSSKRRRARKQVQTQDLGTKYGESITDHCSTTSFYRLTTKPEEVWQMWYDTMSALRKKGIPTHRARKQASRPDPFPESTYVAPGFAKPPR
jgi:hypothetical protein